MPKLDKPPTTLPLLFLLFLLWGLVGHFDYQDEQRMACARKGGTYNSSADTCEGLPPKAPDARPANLSRAPKASQAEALTNMNK